MEVEPITSNYDLMMAEAEVLSAYENLTAEEKAIHGLSDVVTNLIDACENLKACDNLGEYGFIMNYDGGLESFLGGNNDIDKAALENKFTEAISEGFKKFMEMLKSFALKVKEYIQKLFKTMSYKIGQILEHGVERLNFDKKTTILSRENYIKVGTGIMVLTKFVKENIQLNSTGWRAPSNTDQVLNSIAVQNAGVFTQASVGGKLSADGPATKFEELTISEAEYAINDIIKMCGAYKNRTEEYTTIGEMFKTLGDKLLQGMAVKSAPQYESVIRGVINADISAYSAMTKLHSITARNIVGFYRCLEDSDITVKEENTHAQISYAA